jgi:aryl-phospho-beta-D-glucosidase BglC (GH1 family)
MVENWGYLLEEDIAPVWVGEFGAARAPVGEGDVNYWGNLMRYLEEVKGDGGMGFAYWALNPRKPHGGEDETYGLVRDDWEGVVWDYRMRDMRALMEVE